MTLVPANEHRSALISLLQAEKLPTGDLPPNLPDFIAILENGTLIGAAGLEIYGDCGLLRSVVVAAARRGGGVARQLLEAIESRAKENGLKSLFLLTETAAGYFENKGYQTINREEVPGAVKQSSEFSHVCPVSATVMKKDLF